MEAMLEDILTPALRANAAFKSAETGQGSDGRVRIRLALSIERCDCLSSCVV